MIKALINLLIPAHIFKYLCLVCYSYMYNRLHYALFNLRSSTSRLLGYMRALSSTCICVPFVIAYSLLVQPVAYGRDEPIVTDSRIKTFVYSENEVFPIVLHFGYQTAIEFGRGETIQTYSVGNNYAWQFSAVGRTLFIKPFEENIMTNMTVITNKRRYYFELVSKMAAEVIDEEMAYAIRFFYPDDAGDTLKPADTASIDAQAASNIDIIKPYNFNYIVSGPTKIAPSSAFDDGIKTYFQYEEGVKFMPEIHIIENGKKTMVDGNVVGNYLVVNKIGSNFELNYKGQKAEVKQQQ